MSEHDDLFDEPPTDAQQQFRGVTDKIRNAEVITDAPDQVLFVTTEAWITRDEMRALHRVITRLLPGTKVITLNNLTLSQPMSRLHAQQLLESLLRDDGGTS